jgi:hypothetical protein
MIWVVRCVSGTALFIRLSRSGRGGGELIEMCASLCWVSHWSMRVVAGMLPSGAGNNVYICVVVGASVRFLDECRGCCVMGGK